MNTNRAVSNKQTSTETDLVNVTHLPEEDQQLLMEVDLLAGPGQVGL